MLEIHGTGVEIKDGLPKGTFNLSLSESNTGCKVTASLAEIDGAISALLRIRHLIHEAGEVHSSCQECTLDAISRAGVERK